MNEVEFGKLPIIANYTCNLFQNYFKRVKIWCIVAHLYKTPPIILYWKYRGGIDLDFKFGIIASQVEGNIILCITNEEVGATTFHSQWLKIWRGIREILGSNKKCSRNGKFHLSNINFVQKQTVRVFWLLKFYRVQFFEYWSYREPTVFMNFQNFLLNFK